ncbi:multicopper oxidase domain-containing protein [Luteococcus peritonei]
MLLWMLAAVVMVNVHRFVPRSTWLLVHFMTLGVASNAIVVWSNHFADAVLRTGSRGHRREVVELALLNAALVLLSVGVVGQWAVPVWIGAAALAAMAGYIIVELGGQARSSLPARFAMTVRWYQWAALCLLVGVVLGALMAVPFGRWADGLLTSHLVLNVLGWIGLTVWGTLATLWPTMLRARADDGTERAARRALPVMLVGIVLLAAAPLLAGPAALAWRLAALAGTAAYLTAVVLQLGPILRAWRVKPTTSFAVLSAAAAQAWMVVWLLWLAVLLVTSAGQAELVASLRQSVPLLVVGFLAQVLAGALSYLLPVVLGGGPAMVRTTSDVFERGAVARWALLNLGLATFLLPITSVWKVTTSLAVFLVLACFPVLVWRAWRLRSHGEARDDLQHQPSARRIPRGLAWALAWWLVVAGLAVAVDPVGFRSMLGSSDASGGVSATGQTTTVDVVAKDMRFVPDVVQVPAGNRLVINLVNQDPGMIHDLILATGQTSGRLEPGGRTTLDVGVVGESVDGWCSVAGHRQLGMVFRVETTGGAAQPSSSASSGMQHDHGATGTAPAPTLDQSRDPAAGWKARVAALPPATTMKVHKLTLTATEEVQEVSPGVQQTVWTFNGAVPGPVLRGRVGDVFEVTLVNDGTMGHSIDFHAGSVAPEAPMRTIAPGESLVYRFTAKRAGVWMYHCSTAPMSLHIANGMYGAVVIDPPDLPKVDREYVLVQGEQYYGAPAADGSPGIASSEKIAQEKPDAVVFNGYAGQYDRAPLAARVGERVRIWVLDAGPTRPLAFHVVGGQFDSVWTEGSWKLRNGTTPGVPGSVDGGSQTLGLLASQGGFVEMAFTEAGRYPFVNHQMVDAERGAHGFIEVSR